MIWLPLISLHWSSVCHLCEKCVLCLLRWCISLTMNVCSWRAIARGQQLVMLCETITKNSLMPTICVFEPQVNGHPGHVMLFTLPIVHSHWKFCKWVYWWFVGALLHTFQTPVTFCFLSLHKSFCALLVEESIVNIYWKKAKWLTLILLCNMCEIGITRGPSNG